MLCSETGGHEVVHLPHLKLDLARDVNDLIGTTTVYGQGEGEIKLKVQHGKVPVIEWMVRKIRSVKKAIH